MSSFINLEAEAAVLGSILLEGDLFKELEIEEKHFYHLPTEDSLLNRVKGKAQR